MGWWAQTESGGIDWKGDANNEVLWGDTPADIIIDCLSDSILEAFVKCNEAFEERLDRPMTPREFLGGLAFHLQAIEASTQLASLMGDGNQFSLQVKVVEIDGEE